MAPPASDLRALNGMRAYAALLVVLVHLGGPAIAPLPAGLRQFVEGCAYVGLGVFFVLSGFILVVMYGAKGPLDRRRFYVARLARVYPMHLFALLLTLPFAAVVALRTDGWAEVARHLFFSVTLLLPWSTDLGGVLNFPAWSLGVEAFFYLLFPFVLGPVLRLPYRAVVPAMAVVWAASLLAPAAYLAFAPDGRAAVGPHDALPWLNVLKWNPLVHLPEFLVGMLAARLYLRGVRLPGWAGDLAVVALFAMTWAAPSLPYVLVHAGLFVPMYALRTLALAGGRGTIVGWHKATPLVRLGEASYSLYVLHVPLWYIVEALDKRTLALGPAALFWPYLVLLVGVSLVAHRWIEGPARLVVSRLFAPRGAVRPAPAD